MDFTNIETIIRGYWEVLKLFPGFSNMTLEHIESHENAVMFAISKEEVLFDTFTNDLLHPDIKTTTITITISKREKLVKGEKREIKPE